MSSFHCHHCGAACIELDGIQRTGCEHYPADGADYRHDTVGQKRDGLGRVMQDRGQP